AAQKFYEFSTACKISNFAAQKFYEFSTACKISNFALQKTFGFLRDFYMSMTLCMSYTLC
ncbi:hypothetical protein, partial [Methanobacterium bryantii]|uniref:hypothetical protein n=1 Tax=Methanobacterium bryantii TaxID=2161 RepID=UPI001C530040